MAYTAFLFMTSLKRIKMLFVAFTYLCTLVLNLSDAIRDAVAPIRASTFSVEIFLKKKY